MATERNMSSVLAKLMCIDKPSISHNTHQRHRVLSDSYFQNIASVTKREKALPLSTDADFDMDASEDLVCRTGNSFYTGRLVSSSSSSSGDQKRKKTLAKHNNELHLQEKRMSGSSNSIKSPNQSFLSSQEIAKQITEQVNQSIWHSFAESSKSRRRSEMSSEYKEEEIMTASACLFNSEKKYEALSFNPVMESACRDSQKAKDQLSGRWKKRKCSNERTSRESKNRDEVFVTRSNRRNFVSNTSDGNLNTPLYTTDGNGWPVLAARYLSKPALYPSAWVPRSRARPFTLDRNWSLRPGKRVGKQRNDLQEDNSTSELSSCSSDSENPCNHQSASLILNDSAKLTKQPSSEETSTASESLSNGSQLSNIGSSSYPEAHRTLNEYGPKDRSDMFLTSNCNSAPLSSGDGEPCKHQLKNKSYASEQPRSPVSSLEGPEGDSRHVLNLNVLAEEHLSVSDLLDNDAQGLQRKLQLIETMSLESISEGPEMVVSSDEGEDGSSIQYYQNDPQIIEAYQTLIKECWDFSYVVDVVAESGLEMRNLEMGSSQGKDWCLKDYVLDPSVFDSLEKKYGKSMQWEKSERRLLFDRLNLVLIETAKASVGLNTWRKPVTKRFRGRERSEEVEEVLWSLLVQQQEELKRDSSDKVRTREMEWLDLEEDTDLIVQEIQSFLIDELIQEFVCRELFIM